MTEGDLVTQLVSYTDNVSPSTAGIDDRKARILVLAQETLNSDIWYKAEWWFRWDRFTVTLAPGDKSATIAASVDGFDFSDFPASGGRCYNAVTGQQVYLRPPQYIQEYQENPSDQVAYPSEFSIYGIDDTTKGPLFQTRKVTQAVSLAMWAHKRPLTLSLNVTDYMLPFFPDEWARGVLVPGTRIKMQKSKGDVLEWQSQFNAGFASMLAECPQMKAGHWGLQGFFGD